MPIHYSLASLGLVVLAGSCLAAYLFGYEAGKRVGRQQGHDEGHQRGKKEGAVRAFAVGYERGKREREEPEEEEDEKVAKPARPSLAMFFFLAVTTVLLLSLCASLRQRGLF